MITTKICDLKHGSSNVQIEGVVRRKSTLCDGPVAKYFVFHLYDASSDNIRIAAFKETAIALFDKIENGKSYRIAKVSASTNTFRGASTLQIVLTKTAEITPIDDVQVPSIVLTPLSKLKNIAKGTSVNVIARIVDFTERNISLAQGDTKVLTVTLMEKDFQLDATFWDHKEIIKDLPPDELSLTILLIENAAVNVYNNSITINVGKSSVVKVNPENDVCSELREISSDSVFINLSQPSSQSSTQSEYSSARIVSAIKRDLNDIDDELKGMEEKQERLKIRKMLLTHELNKYE